MQWVTTAFVMMAFIESVTKRRKWILTRKQVGLRQTKCWRSRMEVYVTVEFQLSILRNYENPTVFHM